MKTIRTPKAVQLPSGSWRCRVRIAGEDISIVASTRKEAETKAAALKLGIVQADKKEKASPVTLRKAIDRYVESRHNLLAPSTIRGYRIIQNHRCQDLMDKRIDTITRQMIQTSIDNHAADLSHKTLKNTLGLLSTIFRDNDIEINWSKIALSQPEKTEKAIYTEAEQRDLMLAVRGTDVEIPVLLAMWLGMRRSEILGLKWEDVDFAAGKIHVRRALVQNEENKFVEKGTKTKDSTRSVSCPDYIMGLLSRQERKGERVVPMSPQTMRNHLVKIAEDNGLPFYGLHAMRHTNASVMLTLMPDKYAMERGGWSNEKTLKQIYQHTFDSEKAAADEAVNNYFENLIDAPKKKPRKYKLSRGQL